MGQPTELDLDTIQGAIDDIKAGKVVIVVDDEDRENEGDFICAAECITPDIVNFMVTHGRGLVCLPLTAVRAEELGLQMMVNNNTDPQKTAFTVSIDYKHKGCTTGISSYDRATCIKAVCDLDSKMNDFSRPGHIFPLIAKKNGVLRRTGHTEAAIDLAQLAGFAPAGVLIEILNEDGTMARLPQLFKIAERFDLKVVSIKDLVAYRMRMERLIHLKNTVEINTIFGKFTLMSYEDCENNQTHIVLKKGKWKKNEPVLTRVHASANATDLLSALMQGTDSQLLRSLQAISKEGKGVILLFRYGYEKDGLSNIIESMSIQKKEGKTLNPYAYNAYKSEHKDIGIGSQILNDIGLTKIKLLTNNPRPLVGLKGYGLEVVEYIAF
ncbi:MAG: 3,4-dihydroxy-2-butanone-4-phosphate synthase [Saprospiraceae bacterium]